MMTDRDYMILALEEARRAASEGEVPVGAVIVCQNEVIAVGRNRREATQSALTHAEIEAIKAACAHLGSWRLDGSTIYVTLEPCPMCAGAILNARIARLVYGVRDPKMGAAGSLIDLFAVPFPHHADMTSGVMEDASAALLCDFFASLRQKGDHNPATYSRPLER